MSRSFVHTALAHQCRSRLKSHLLLRVVSLCFQVFGNALELRATKGRLINSAHTWHANTYYAKKKSQVEICISVSFTSGGKTPSWWAAKNLPFTTLGDMVSRTSRQLTARKAVVVNIQNKSFDSFPDNMMKLSLNKQNRLVCQLRPALFFFRFWFDYLISGPKRYRDPRATAPDHHGLTALFYKSSCLDCMKHKKQEQMQKSYRLLFSVSRLYLRETQASIYKADAAQYKQKNCFSAEIVENSFKGCTYAAFPSMKRNYPIFRFKFLSIYPWTSVCKSDLITRQ